MFLKVREETMLIAYKEQVYYMHVFLKDISLTSNNYGMTVIAQADAGSYVRSHEIFVQNRLQSPLILTGLKFFSVCMVSNGLLQ